VHFEKVTSRSGQSALAGWISSNDVTLFTTVLVMAIAMFLHTRMTQGAKENVQISQEKASLTKQLEATAGELDSSMGLLDTTRKTLNLTQQERDSLRHELVDKLTAVAALNTKLDALLKDKDLLESQQRSLTAAKDSLSKEKTNLLAQQASLNSDRDSLKNANLNLRERLDLITSQLANKVAALERLEKERERLKKQTDELDAIVSGLKQRLAKLNIDLVDTRTQSETRLRELESQVARSEKNADDYLIKLKRATELFEGLKVEKHELEQRLTQAALDHQAALLEESRNNRELVGLTGRLERVAILFDASGSMRQSTTTGAGDRWAEAQRIAATWLQHLNVQQCVLIVFSSDVRTFPENGSLADLRGETGKVNRELLLQRLKSVSPDGATNTYDALRKAYQYDIDSILLFSDGAPSESAGGVFEPAVAQRIYDLCRAHPNIPIHTIGLGNYFDQNASTFLMSLAKLTSGTFRGQ
jgi:chromosome segregation ATPase